MLHARHRASLPTINTHLFTDGIFRGRLQRDKVRPGRASPSSSRARVCPPPRTPSQAQALQNHTNNGNLLIRSAIAPCVTGRMAWTVAPRSKKMASAEGAHRLLPAWHDGIGATRQFTSASLTLHFSGRCPGAKELCSVQDVYDEFK